MDNENEKQENSLEEKNSLQEGSPRETPEDEQKSHSQVDGADDESINHWIKEISDSSEFPKNELAENLYDLEASKGELPDWINTLSSEEDPKHNQSDGELIKNNSAANIESEQNLESIDSPQIKIFHEKQNEEEDSKLDIHEDSDEGFVEISSYELGRDEESETAQQAMTEDLQENEALPNWLEDMIEDQSGIDEEEPKEIDENPLFIDDEATKPIIITEEFFSDDDQEHDAVKEPETPELSLDEIELEEKEYQLEENIHIVDFDEAAVSAEARLIEEKPLDLDQAVPEESSVEPGFHHVKEELDHQLIDTPVENREAQDHQTSEFPKTLRFGKYLLDQGEIDQAYEIFRTYIEKSTHLDEIKIWVSEAIKEEKSSKSTLLEILGDIALKEDNPPEALSAYSKAISVLLNEK